MAAYVIVAIVIEDAAAYERYRALLASWMAPPAGGVTGIDTDRV